MFSHNGSRKHARYLLPLWALLFRCATAQQCYYPDGSLASGQNECLINGAAFSQCCPQGWTCDTNGLCQDPTNNNLGRYSCTDKSWGSSCPNFCTNNGFTGKDQTVLQCSDKRYCCDGDGTSGNCCDDGAARFTLAPVGQTPESSAGGGSSSAAPASSSTSPASSPPASSSSASSGTPSSSGTSPSSNNTPQSNTVISTSTSASIESASGRPVSTITKTAKITSTGTSSSTAGTISNGSNNSSSSDHKSLIIGLAVGIPVGIAALAIPIIFLLFRRHRRHSLVRNERRRTQVADAYSGGENDWEPKSPKSPVAPEYANGAGFYSARHVQRPSEMDGGTAGIYQAVNSDPVELSAEPQTPGMPETAATPGANQSQSPSEGRLVGGLAYAHRPHSSNPEYQAYPAELPSPT